MDVRRALEEVLLRAAWREPGCTWIDTPRLARVITPSIPFPYANTVYRLAGDAEELARVIASYRDHGLPFRFIVGPSSQPSDLGRLLIEHGLSLTSELAAMWAPTAVAIPEPPSVEVEALTEETVDEYVATSAAGWAMSDAQAANLRRSVVRDLGLGTYRALIARIEGAAAGVALLRTYDRLGYLQGSAVHPDKRGRGVYRALVAHRMRMLHDAGIEVGLIHARTTTAAPICARLGFRTEFHSTVYEQA